MRPKLLSVLALLLMATQPLYTEEMAEEPSGEVTADERAELVELLEESRSELEALAAHATGDDWNWKPSEDRWSVGEVVEHLVLTEEGFLGMVDGSLEGGPDPEWQATLEGPNLAGIVGMMEDRSQKFQAPAEFVPTGEPSREELLSRFASLRARSLDFVRSTHAPLKKHTAEGPAGKMNVYQWMAFCGAHNLRHNLQIRELFETLHPIDGEWDSDSRSDRDSHSDSDSDSDSESDSDSDHGSRS